MSLPMLCSWKLYYFCFQILFSDSLFNVTKFVFVYSSFKSRMPIFGSKRFLCFFSITPFSVYFGSCSQIFCRNTNISYKARSKIVSDFRIDLDSILFTTQKKIPGNYSRFSHFLSIKIFVAESRFQKCKKKSCFLSHEC